jgi:hypothetical protein
VSRFDPGSRPQNPHHILKGNTMGKPPKPLAEGERVNYTHPLRGTSERVVIVRFYQTRTGRRAIVLTKGGDELSVRPSQLTRR